jgi:hypothetical protein
VDRFRRLAAPQAVLDPPREAFNLLGPAEASHVDNEFLVFVDLLLKVSRQGDDFRDIFTGLLEIVFQHRRGARLSIGQARVALRGQRLQQ